MKEDYIRIRVRKRDKEDFKKMLKEQDISMSEYLYDYLKQELNKWRLKNIN